MGQLDANGVWEYDLDDPPYSPEALNLGMASVSNVLASGVHIQRVANTSERDSYLSDFVASVGGTPTAANPCVVWRGNNSANRYIEFTVDGVNWVPLSQPLQDTGWVTLTLASGFTATQVFQIRRIGMAVWMRGVVTPSTNWGAAGTNSTIVASGGIPADMRPVSGYVAAQIAIGSSVGATFRVTPQVDGSLTVLPQQATSTAGVFLGGVSWVVG